MKVIVKYDDTNQFVNITADRLTCDSVSIFAYNGDQLVGAFNPASVDMIYLSEEKEK